MSKVEQIFADGNAVEKLAMVARWPMRIPTRRYKLNRSRSTFTVPRHIVRCDSMSMDGRVHSRGWQVRYPNGEKRSRFFSDGVSPPHKSLERAKAYLRSIYRGPLSAGLHTREAARKKMGTGLPGIRYVTKESRGKKITEYYIEVGAVPSLQTGPKRFYVGTANTITHKRFKSAWHKAVQLRRQLVDQVKQRA